MLRFANVLWIYLKRMGLFLQAQVNMAAYRDKQQERDQRAGHDAETYTEPFDQPAGQQIAGRRRA